MNGLAEYSNAVAVTIDSEDDVVQEAVSVFNERLQSFKPRTIKRTPNGLRYTAGVMRLVWTVNLLYSISDGELTIEKRDQTLTVHYVIRFHEIIALSVIPAASAIVILDSVMAKTIGVVLVLLVHFVGNVLMTILRYKRFIKKTLHNWLLERKPIAMSDDQKEWIGNANKCDACGYSISVADVECPDCGLSLR